MTDAKSKLRRPKPEYGSQKPEQAFEPYIDRPEVARRLNKDVRTVDRWRKRRVLPYYKIGRDVLFKWSEVEERLKRLCHVNCGEGSAHR